MIDSDDDNVLSELLESFEELANEIELGLDAIIYGKSIDHNTLYRNISTIKANAAVLQIQPIVEFTNSLEGIFEVIRNGKRNPSSALCEVLQLGMDRLSDIHNREVLGYSYDNLQEVELQELFVLLAECTPEEVNNTCLSIMDLMGVGFVHESSIKSLASSSPSANKPDSKTPSAVPGILDSTELFAAQDLSDKKLADLCFFKEIAQQIDKQTQYWEGRSEQLHDWALKVNEIRGNPVSPEQLAAATYLHDIGMSFIPTHILEKEGRLDKDELSQIQTHPIWGQAYLSRIPGWEDAAEIIMQHHERIDGSGYPMKLIGTGINDGAKILAIIDAFFSITSGRADRAKRRSILRAVSEINANVGTQFDESWTAAFNEMLKVELRSGTL